MQAAPAPTRALPGAARPPPARIRGPLAWARAHLFGGRVNTAATLLFGAALVWLVPRLVRWAVTGAVYRADYAACRALDHRAAFPTPSSGGPSPPPRSSSPCWS